MLWLLHSVALAAAPSVQVSWLPGGATLVVAPPPGHTIAEDFDAHVVLTTSRGTHTVDATGAQLAAGIGIGEVRGEPLTGELRLGLCDKKTGVCAPLDFAIGGTAPDRRRGQLALTVADAHHEPPSPFGPDADAAPADVAFERARAHGTVVLLDFSAVWCPPCMMLAAEVLHADPPSEALEGYEVAVLDVDHASSFALKDRYDVGGYPTVVAVDADGNELARIVGYPGRTEFEDWLLDAGTGRDAQDLAAGPAAATPERAAELAWMLARTGQRDEAGPWLDRAGSVDSVERVLAAATLEPTPEHLSWLLEHAHDRVPDWFGVIMKLADDHPELAQRAARVGIDHTRGVELADALYVAAAVATDPAQAELLYGAGAAALASTLDGSPRDKGNITFLADLYALSGQLPRGLTLLEQWSARFPDEPTFELTRARLLLEAAQFEAALEAADEALRRSWGDNRLRSATAKAEALIALDRRAEAAELASTELAAFEPDPELDVRTHRYRARLQAVATGE